MRRTTTADRTSRMINQPLIALLISLLTLTLSANAQMRGSIIEDRAARKLLEAGDARVDANETEKALEIWQSVIERYPRSRVRFQAHMRLGDYHLNKNNDFDSARGHFETAAAEDNSDSEERAEATLKSGICYYEAHHYGQCFKVMRKVIESFPTSKQVNQAYYYIGMGHFKQGHYSRAIEALEKVGTALTEDDTQLEKLEAGKRLFVKIEDADLAILKRDETVDIECVTTSGDTEILSCVPVGRNVRVVLGSIQSSLGKAVPNNGHLEIRGGDKVQVNYIDRHTSEEAFNLKRIKEIQVVGDAIVQIMDGAFHDELQGVVLGKEINLQVVDADFDTSDAADKLTARVAVYRLKTQDELDTEIAELVSKGAIAPPDEDDLESDDQGPVVDKWKEVDSIEATFTEFQNREVAEDTTTSATSSPVLPDGPSLPGSSAPSSDVDDFLAEVEAEAGSIDSSVHSGLFRVNLQLEKVETPTTGDAILQAMPSDQVRIIFEDTVNRLGTPATRIARATCIEGNLGGVRVTQTDIEDEELKLKTRLRTASALCNIGNHYKEFGLDAKAKVKYAEALGICDEINKAAQKLGGALLEETYVQLWRIYFAMDELKLASAVSQRLQREFPNSSFVDEAIYQQAEIARQQGNLPNAIGLFSNLLRLQNSSLAGEGQYGIAACYEAMAEKESGDRSMAMYEKAFEEYKKVYSQFPESGRVGDAVAKMANFYYQKKDYARAVDVFENVLDDHPDAAFLDVILFNYGRCLYRLDKKAEARRNFDQLLNDYPDSQLAGEAKRISDALVKSGF